MRKFDIGSKKVADGIVLIRVTGWLDAHTFDLMDQAINNHFSEGNVKLIIDLEHVEYISSAGAGVFIGAFSTAQEQGGNVVLLNPAQGVREVFDLLGLSQIFKFTTTIQEGVQLVNSPA